MEPRRPFVLLNPYVWIGLLGLVGVGVGLFVLFNQAVLPAYTRQGVGVQVPDLRRTQADAAEAQLRGLGLRVERVPGRFDASKPRGMVTDQEPAGGQEVKPGRLVYLTVNEGRRQRVRMPSLVGASLREARSQIQGLGLAIAEERADTIPSPYKNTVTGQVPTAGDSVVVGTPITLFYSTGPSDRFERVPNVVGLTVAQARETLLRSNLRALVMDAEGSADPQRVRRQGREPGTSVRGGYEVRLYVKEDTTSAYAGPAEANVEQ